jgi:uncharacterized membrane protein YhaH (DUF805 family)
MGFGQAISSCLSKFFTFAGRAPRSEYWYFYLFFVLAIVVAVLIGGVTSAALSDESGEYGGLVTMAAVLILFFPQLSVTVRRLHDLDRSGWWWWLSFVPLVGGLVLLVWFCLKGTEGNNRSGPNPLNPVPVGVFD